MGNWDDRRYLQKVAVMHHSAIEVLDNYKTSIIESVLLPQSTDSIKSPKVGKYDTKLMVTENDSVTELFLTGDRDDVCILNFASYRYPGGMFFQGSKAQEEYLCHHSNLYEVLNAFRKNYYIPHKQTLNHGMYTGHAIYSPNITFYGYPSFEDSAKWSNDVLNGNKPCSEVFSRWSDVITMAAPNRKVACDYQSIPYMEYLKCLKQRIYNLMLNMYKVEPGGVLILGAWGCGVFKNDPGTVAKLFKLIIGKYFKGIFKEIRFAIPKDYTKHHEIFKEIIEGEM